MNSVSMPAFAGRSRFGLDRRVTGTDGWLTLRSLCGWSDTVVVLPDRGLPSAIDPGSCRGGVLHA
jgi:hypothetical protein